MEGIIVGDMTLNELKLMIILTKIAWGFCHCIWCIDCSCYWGYNTPCGINEKLGGAALIDKIKGI